MLQQTKIEGNGRNGDGNSIRALLHVVSQLSDWKPVTVDVLGSAANLAKSQHRFGSQSGDRLMILLGGCFVTRVGTWIRALTDAYKKIDEICDTMNLSSVIRVQVLMITPHSKTLLTNFQAKHNFKSYDEESKKVRWNQPSLLSIARHLVYSKRRKSPSIPS